MSLVGVANVSGGGDFLGKSVVLYVLGKDGVAIHPRQL